MGGSETGGVWTGVDGGEGSETGCGRVWTGVGSETGCEIETWGIAPTQWTC